MKSPSSGHLGQLVSQPVVRAREGLLDALAAHADARRDLADGQWVVAVEPPAERHATALEGRQALAQPAAQALSVKVANDALADVVGVDDFFGVLERDSEWDECEVTDAAHR
jgi:hypothetical protein